MATIALGQMNAGDNAAANLEKIAQLAAQAAAGNADLLVLPEYAMAYPQKGQPFPAAQTLNGPFVIGLRTLAKRHRMYILCGILEYSGDSKPYNTVVLLDRYGEIVCIHRKNHMYDTMKYRESEHFLLGNDLFQTADTDFGRLGVMICYEIRFPELARIQVLDGAQLLIVCAAFVTGPSKALQWHTLLSARAIENGVFICGCNHVKPKVFLGKAAPTHRMGNCSRKWRRRKAYGLFHAIWTQSPSIVKRIRLFCSDGRSCMDLSIKAILMRKTAFKSEDKYQCAAFSRFWKNNLPG